MKLGCLLLCHWPKRREGKPCAASCPDICQSFCTSMIPGVKSRSTESSTSLSLAQTKSCSTKRFHGCHGWLRHLVRRLLRNLRLRHCYSHRPVRFPSTSRAAYIHRHHRSELYLRYSITQLKHQTIGKSWSMYASKPRQQEATSGTFQTRRQTISHAISPL